MIVGWDCSEDFQEATYLKIIVIKDITQELLQKTEEEKNWSQVKRQRNETSTNNSGGRKKVGKKRDFEKDSEFLQGKIQFCGEAYVGEILKKVKRG